MRGLKKLRKLRKSSSLTSIKLFKKSETKRNILNSFVLQSNLKDNH